MAAIQENKTTHPFFVSVIYLRGLVTHLGGQIVLEFGYFLFCCFIILYCILFFLLMIYLFIHCITAALIQPLCLVSYFIILVEVGSLIP